MRYNMKDHIHRLDLEEMTAAVSNININLKPKVENPAPKLS